MDIDTSAPRTRRAILAAALGGIAATAANALGRPARALATDGQPIIQGQTNTGTAGTVVAVGNTTALQGVTDASSGTHYGVRGRSAAPNGAGVVGVATATTGANYGLRGYAAGGGGGGVRGEAPLLGIEGIATSAAAGVGGRVAATGPNSIGLQTSGSIAVYASGTTHGIQVSATEAASRAVFAFAHGDGASVAVHGQVTSPTAIGIVGKSITTTAATGRGIVGTAVAGIGIQGWAGAGEPTASVSKTGVHGECVIDAASTGVHGASTIGTGVRGTTGTGVGVLAKATAVTGSALKVEGKAVFSRSGKTTVPTGQTQVSVENLALTASSFVVATIQGAGASGLYVRNVSVSVANSRITIKLSKAPSANTIVGWFLVN